MARFVGAYNQTLTEKDEKQWLGVYHEGAADVYTRIEKKKEAYFFLLHDLAQKADSSPREYEAVLLKFQRCQDDMALLQHSDTFDDLCKLADLYHTLRDFYPIEPCNLQDLVDEAVAERELERTKDFPRKPFKKQPPSQRDPQRVADWRKHDYGRRRKLEVERIESDSSAEENRRALPARLPLRSTFSTARLDAPTTPAKALLMGTPWPRSDQRNDFEGKPRRHIR